jgi:hypothetical protein
MTITSLQTTNHSKSWMDVLTATRKIRDDGWGCKILPYDGQSGSLLS